MKKQLQINISGQGFATFFKVEVDENNIGRVIHQSPSLYENYYDKTIDLNRLKHRSKLAFIENVEGSDHWEVDGIYEEGNVENLVAK